MFETLRRLYNEEKINGYQLISAVIKGWITEEQANEIEGE